MSDGVLSQDEIDSLLAELGPTSGTMPMSKAAPSGLSPSDISAFTSIISGLTETHAQTISMMVGKDVNLSLAACDTITRDGLLPSLPDEVMAVNADFTGSVAGDHLFLLPKEAAIKIAALASHDDNLTELDDMATSVVSECVSSLTASTVNEFTAKTNSPTIGTDMATGSFGPKAIAKLPSGNFVRVVYNVTIDSIPFTILEIFSSAVVKNVLSASGMQAANTMGAGMPAMGGAMPSMGMSAMGGGMPSMGGGMPAMGGAMHGGGAQMFQQPIMQQQQSMYQSPIMAQPNVQPVQFANLGMGHPVQEAGNIGLIMDVYMELTVELGRTKRLIKDILGLGEGNIIELDKLAGEPVDILVNHKLIAKGEVVVIDENFGVRVTEIVSPMERVNDFS